MSNRALDFFSTVKTEGAMLPPEILVRIAQMDAEMGGLTPDAYHLDKGEKVNEAINRSWNRLLGAWGTFRKAQEVLLQEDSGTSLTREKWLLKLFDELGYGRLLPSKPFDVEGKIYPVSHFWQHTPIHLIGFRTDLDKHVAHYTGAYRYKPHSMVQEFLNRTEGHLWAFLSNGLQLRILRDNTSLVRQAYVEFDLEAMMDGGIFPDFKLLWLLCHQSRVEADRPEDCWLENWTRVTQVVGTRAREDLRNGVQRAIEALGAGFLAHPTNDSLREDLRTGHLDKQDYYRELLRFVYQLIFLFVAEDRDLLAPPSTTPEAKNRYIRYYSTARLRLLAGRKAGTRHDDLYRVTRLVIGSLGEGEGRKELGIPILNSSLFSTSATPSLRISLIANMDYLKAIRVLAITSDRHGRRPTDFRNLGSEELGSIYESLLELHPDVNIEAKTFSLMTTAGNERKTTGSYYTPTRLISCLLDSALDPVLDEATGKENPEQAILALKVCDPACGSGHFLIAAAHRMAGRVASIRAGGDEPTSDLYRRALRDVIGHCIYGVDVNPMSVELCKVSLWMEALEPGKPLSFLDHHIRAGNSLLGATPELIAAGLPDEAFTPIEGDDKKACAVLKKRNKAERKGLGPLFAQQEAETQTRLQQAAAALEELPDDRPEDIRAKDMAFRSNEETDVYRHKRKIADTWCAAFIIRKHFREPGRESSACGITQGDLIGLAKGRLLPAELSTEVERLACQYRFFHWHLVFPEVFAKGGFDCVFGNPPWEKMTVLEQEFFSHIPEIGNEQRANRRKAMIAKLEQSDPYLFKQWNDRLREASDAQSFVSLSGRFPLTAVGELNLFPLFSELAFQVLGPMGEAGMIVKSSLLLSPTWSDFTAMIVDRRALRAAYDFRNWEGWFPGIGYHERFTLLHFGKAETRNAEVKLGFYFDAPEDATTQKLFLLSADDLSALNPITKTLPVFDSQESKLLLIHIYKQFATLASATCGWRLSYTTGFHMSSDASLLRSKEELMEQGYRKAHGAAMVASSGVYLPLMEGKLLHQFDPRFASFEGIPSGNRFGKKAATTNPTNEQKGDPNFSSEPRYWIAATTANENFEKRGVSPRWAFTFRDTTNVISNFRTAVGSMCSGWCYNYKAPNMVLRQTLESPAKHVLAFCALFNSFPFDYVVRQKFFGANLIKSILDQLACPSPDDIQHIRAFVETRALELTYTAWDLEPFAQDCGWSGPPFRWDEERRFLLHCELDAAFFNLYLATEANGDWRTAEGETAEDLTLLKASFPTPRDAVAYIMDTFPILKRRDEEKYGSYRTKDTILEIYDEMARVSAENVIALATGLQPTARYHARLNPPPGPPFDAQGNVIQMAQWDRANWPSHIHQPREVVVTPPEEIPMTAFAAIAYPSTDGDKAISAAALAVVEQSGGLSSVEHLDALLLATHPDWCRVFLDQKDLPMFNAAVRSAPGALFVGQNQSIRWKDCRDYLERLNVLTVAHGNQGQSIAVGTALPSAKATLPQGVDTVVAYVFKALDHIRKLRQDLSTVPQVQRSILDAFTEQHRLYELAA